MKADLVEKFRAILSSRKFARFFDSVDFVLPNRELITIKVSSVRRRQNELGFRFSKFSYMAKSETSHGVVGYGFGESESKLLSIQKSVAESIERATYHSLKPYTGDISSNGWAAHLSVRDAERSALYELIERDAVLVHWLTKFPFKEIEQKTFPNWLKKWTDSELVHANAQLRLLVAYVGHLPAVSSVITISKKTYISQGAARSLDSAIYKALAETCRIISISRSEDKSAIHTVKDSERAKPWDHALHYANSTAFPIWPFGETISYKDAKRKNAKAYRRFDPRTIAPKFTTVSCGPIFVSQSKSDRIQNLFFGGTDYADKNGLINHQRLKEVVANYELNPLPHCVP